MNNKVKIDLIKNESDFKVLNISGEPGNVLRSHKVNINALLLMRSGNIIYKEENELYPLSSGEIHVIPANVLHEVSCTTKAKFFIVMPDQAKIKFEK